MKMIGYKHIAVGYNLSVNPPMKRTVKPDRPVQPISLAPRKTSFPLDPNPVNWQNVVLKPLDTNRSHNNAMISTMRQQLSCVRHDVEKLMVDQRLYQTNVTAKMEVQAFKDELGQRREVEQQLRREVRELKAKLEYCGETMNKVKEKAQREREMAEEEIRQLREGFQQKESSYQQRVAQQQKKISLLTDQLSNLQEQTIHLTTECQELQGSMKEFMKPKQDQALQYTEQEIFQLRNRVIDLEKQKFIVSNKLKERQSQINKITEDYQSSLKDKDQKYNSCLNQLKKIQSKVGKSKQSGVIHIKGKIHDLEQSLQSQRQNNESIRAQNAQLHCKLQKIKLLSEEQKTCNEELVFKIKTLQTNLTHAHRTQIATLNQQITESHSQTSSLRQQFEQKCSQLSSLQKSTKNSPQRDELKKAKEEILELEANISNLKTQLEQSQVKLRDTLLSSCEKDNYIKQLYRQRQQNKNQISELENKCRKLHQSQVKVVHQYQSKIEKLQKQLQKVQQLLPTFEENEKIAEQLRSRTEQVVNCRFQIQELKRKIQSMRSHSETDKLKGTSGEGYLKCQFQITIDNLKSQLESQHRKFQALQRKIQFKSEQIRKKDEFIQQVIIRKVAKEEIQPQGQYLRKELSKFFSINYEVRLLAAYQRIHQLENQQNK